MSEEDGAGFDPNILQAIQDEYAADDRLSAPIVGTSGVDLVDDVLWVYANLQAKPHRSDAPRPSAWSLWSCSSCSPTGTGCRRWPRACGWCSQRLCFRT